MVNENEKLSKDQFKKLEEELRVELLGCQSDLMDRDYPVMVVINGIELEPINQVLNAFFEWFDPRWIEPHAMRERTRWERREPFLRRYWKRIPPRGQVALFFGGWTLEAYGDFHNKRVDLAQFTRLLIHMRKFERQLMESGAQIIKLWVGPHPRSLKQLDQSALDLLEGTRWEHAEWSMIDTEHGRNRLIECGEVVAAALRRRLDEGPVQIEAAPLGELRGTSRFAEVELCESLERKEYRERRKKLQRNLGKLADKCADRDIATVCVFEGWDAAGKGGAIRRITQAVDARNWKVVPIAAPTEYDKSRPYLWRFWMRLPRPGMMTMFDRSWYGRVLVERVEGFAAARDWKRAYDEINDFEEQIAQKGHAICKFWLHIDPNEQLRRFNERENTPYKQYKITEEDFRNREKWDDYVEACEEMFARTSTVHAPWTIVPANDKYVARVKVLETVCASLEKALG